MRYMVEERSLTESKNQTKRREQSEQMGQKSKSRTPQHPKLPKIPCPEKNECAKNRPKARVAHAEKKTPVVSCVIKLYKLVYFVAGTFFVTAEERCQASRRPWSLWKQKNAGH